LAYAPRRKGSAVLARKRGDLGFCHKVQVPRKVSDQGRPSLS